MRAQILSIGDEILGGYITDTNSTFLAQQLALLNIELALVTHVGDSQGRIADVIRRALDDSDIVICTGGVGPTEDDLTREAIAQVVGETPTIDDGLLALIKGFFASRGLEMPTRNQKQAWVIPSSDILPNPIGTAPGWYVKTGHKVIAAMPGVPREMFRMWTEQLQPRIAAMQSGRIIRSTTLKTIGIGESMVEQHLHALILRGDPVIATYAKDDGVHIRVTATASNTESAIKSREACVAEVNNLIGEFVYARDETTLAGALLGSLEALNYTIAISDHGGGGRFASLLAEAPGSAETFIASEMQPKALEGTAPTQAATIAELHETEIGIGIAVSYESVGPAVYAASVEIAIAGARTAQRAFPIRSGYEDVQRRSALFAAEVLRSALISD